MFDRPGISIRNDTLYLSSPRLCFFIVISLNLSVDREGSLASWGGGGWSCWPSSQLNVCTTSVTEGEVGPVKLAKAPQ